MTSERDDPEGLDGAAQDDEAGLAEAAGNVVGGALLRDGLSRSAVRAIVVEALEDYARLGRPGKRPRPFVVQQMLAKAELRRKLRGIHAPADPDAGPYLLHVARTQAALATLAPTARAALEMLFREQKSYEEIAEILGMTVAGARRLVSRAMKRLRKWRPGAAEE